MFARVIVVSALGLTMAFAIINPASADEPQRIGHLVIDPARGDLLTPMDVATSDVCTRGTMFAVTLDGPNLTGSDRGNVVGTTKIQTLAPESYPGHYVLPLPTDLATYVASAAPGQRIKGDYTLTFACRDSLSTSDLQVFTADLRIDGNGRYRALGDAATAIDELIDGYVPGSAGFAYGDPAAPGHEVVAEVAASEQASTAPTADPFPWRAALVAVGALLIIAATYMWWRGRRREGARAESTEARSDAPAGVES